MGVSECVLPQGLEQLIVTFLRVSTDWCFQIASAFVVDFVDPEKLSLYARQSNTPHCFLVITLQRSYFGAVYEYLKSAFAWAYSKPFGAFADSWKVPISLVMPVCPRVSHRSALDGFAWNWNFVTIGQKYGAFHKNTWVRYRPVLLTATCVVQHKHKT